MAAPEEIKRIRRTAKNVDYSKKVGGGAYEIDMNDGIYDDGPPEVLDPDQLILVKPLNYIPPP